MDPSDSHGVVESVVDGWRRGVRRTLAGTQPGAARWSNLVCGAFGPLAALFSACALALGVYARSTKEGRYYLLPILLGTMPLVLFSLAPGLELTWRTSLIPVTGLCLLLQKLIFPPPEGLPWLIFRRY